MIEERDRNDDPSNPFGGYRLDGLYVFGPRGMRCSLAILIAMSLLRVSGSSTRGLRVCLIADRSREMQRRARNWLADGADPDDENASLFRAILAYSAGTDERERPRTTKLGRFHVPRTKPAASGRRARVQAA